MTKGTRRATTALFAAGVSVLLTFAAAAPVSATTAEEEAFAELTSSLTAHLTEYDVPAATQDALIAKLRGGELPDSWGGVAPLSTNTSEVDGADVKVERFPDGSVTVTKVELPTPEGVASRGVSGCGTYTTAGQTHRTNCYVDRWDGVVWQNFRADFTYVDNGYDRIDSVGTESGGIVGASGGGKVRFGITKKYENAAGPARAEYVIDGTLPYVGYATRGLGLQVGASIGGQSYTF